jgi:phospholipid transport system substrate-binding protein
MIQFFHKKNQWLTRPLATFIHLTSLFSLLFALLLLTTSTSFADNNQATTQNPVQVIKTTLKKITAFSHNSKNMAMNGSTNSSQASSQIAQLRQFIEQQIIPNFDFDNMAHWITGRYAKSMNEQDKTDFKRSLRETFLSSLTKHLGSFDAENTRIKLHRARYRGKEEAFVSTTIYRPNRLAIRLDFRMRNANNTWKIIDIKANGASAVLYYRRHFISQLRQYQNQRQSMH